MTGLRSLRCGQVTGAEEPREPSRAGSPVLSVGFAVAGV